MTDRNGPLDGATDIHVHLMPDRLMAAIRGALNDEAGWTFPHPTGREAMETELREHGVERYCALPYAHESGVAADLNEWVLERAADSSMCVPFATVHSEDDVGAVVRDAFEAGARGLKFQCPVQGVAPDDPRLDPAFELAAAFDRPVLFHAGTAPMFRDSPHVGVDAFRSFRESFPEVRACCAHMGVYETESFLEVVREYDRTFLDTAYVFGERARRDMGFGRDLIPDRVLEEFSDAIMFGSDYPNVTYEYGEFVEALLDRGLSEETMRNLLVHTPARFLND